MNANVVDIFMMMYWPVSAQVVSGCVGPGGNNRDRVTNPRTLVLEKDNGEGG